MTNMDMVKISISKLAPIDGSDSMFVEDVTMEFNIIQKIIEAKERYKSALNAYFDGLFKGISESFNSDTTSVFELKRLKVMHKKYMALREHYMEMLSNFSIDSFEQVSYRGSIDTRHECVRRFTQIHLEELSEIEQINSVPVVSSKKEYEALLYEFLQIVRFSF